MVKMKKVIIYQRILPHYRIPFFERLYEKLLAEGIDLVVNYGNEQPNTVPKTVHVDRPWARYKKAFYINLFWGELVLQSGKLADFKIGNVIVTEQANRLLINYAFYFLRFINVIKLGFWGHGKNFQSTNSNSLKEKFKRFYSVYTDWWFCYANSGKEIISALGFPTDKITVVRNCLDLDELIFEQERLDNVELEELKHSLGISSNNIAIYCGGMYAEKKIEFLLNACSEIKIRVADYHVIFIGNGPDEHLVSSFCAQNTWAHFVGSISGIERVKYFSIGKVLLMPGAVGLAVLDSFALGLPMITTEIPTHGPEIDYLESGINGLMVEHDVKSYSNNVSDLLLNDEKLQVLIDGCNKSKALFSIETMAQNFANGVVKLLGK
jgi:glycosyltransferase involved in cell wall biosynthesis